MSNNTVSSSSLISRLSVWGRQDIYKSVFGMGGGVCALMVFSLFAAHGLQAETVADSRLLGAYSGMQYEEARKLAQKDMASPKARLVLALSQVFDRRNQELDKGMPELKRIFDDKSLPLDIRMEAGLSYARATQTLRLRDGVYPPAKGIDCDGIYAAIVAEAPDSSQACFAISYQTLDMFSSEDAKTVDAAFSKMNAFIKAYKGPRTLLGPLHYILADQYIMHGLRYAEAVRELELAREAGIANPRNDETVLLRIARIYDVHLHDSALAEANYAKFLAAYPDSASAPVVKRYLKELGAAKSKEVGNG